MAVRKNQTEGQRTWQEAFAALLDYRKDMFFHTSALQGVRFEELREGQKVSYTEGQGKKGPCAENVKPV